MRDRKRRSKTKNGVFRSGFFDQKKKLSYLKKSYIFFLIKKSRSKNAVFRFRSAFSISPKIGPQPENENASKLIVASRFTFS